MQAARLFPVFVCVACLTLDAAAQQTRTNVAQPAKQQPSIDHRAVHCMVADRFPVIEAHVTPAEHLGRTRLLFRAAGTPAWYFVEMRPERGSFVGTLPKPLATTTAIEYYIEAVDRELTETRTADYTAQVVADRGGCPAKLLTAAFLTSAKLAIGALTSGASAVPLGFSGVGIIGGSVAGAAAGGAAAGGGGGGLSTGALIGIVGGAGALAAGAIVATGGGDTWTGEGNLSPADRSCTSQFALTFELSIGSSEVTGKEHEFRVTSGGGQFPCPEPVGSNLVNHTVQNGRVDGSNITFSIVGGGDTVTFAGTISGTTMQGTIVAQPMNAGPGSNVPRAGTFRLQKQ